MNTRLVKNRRGNMGSTIDSSRLARHSQMMKHMKSIPARIKNRIMAAEFHSKCTPPSSRAATKRIEALSSMKAPKGSALNKFLAFKDEMEYPFSRGGSQ